MNFSLQFSDVAFVLSGVFVFLAYLTRSMVRLRALIAASSVLGVIYGALIHQTLYVLGQTAAVLINTAQLVLLLLERKPFLLPEEWKPHYLAVFSAMTPKEFYRFVDSGERIRGADLHLCREGQPPEKLYFVVEGTLAVSTNEHRLAEVKPGSFVGEMSFFTGAPYSADVLAEGEIDCVAWSQSRLAALETKQPEMYAKLLSILGTDLINKLLEQRPAPRADAE